MGATKKTNSKSNKYSDLIQRSASEIEAEQIPIKVELAKNTLEAGILSVKQQCLAAQLEVRKAETELGVRKAALKETFSACPLNVNNILDARSYVKTAEAILTEKQEILSQYQEAQGFLEELMRELF